MTFWLYFNVLLNFDNINGWMFEFSPNSIIWRLSQDSNEDSSILITLDGMKILLIDVFSKALFSIIWSSESFEIGAAIGGEVSKKMKNP